MLSAAHNDSFGLDKMATRVQSGDKTNLEAQAAQRYWPRLFDKSLRRDRYGDPPNNLLNYGYAIIRAATARSLAMAGLHAGIGLFHHSRSNSFPLADDMMELWRPFIDLRVWQIASTEDKTEINSQSKKQLLSLMNETVPFDQDKLPLEIAIQRCSASLASYMLDASKELQTPKGLNNAQFELLA